MGKQDDPWLDDKKKNTIMNRGQRSGGGLGGSNMPSGAGHPNPSNPWGGGTYKAPTPPPFHGSLAEDVQLPPDIAARRAASRSNFFLKQLQAAEAHGTDAPPAATASQEQAPAIKQRRRLDLPDGLNEEDVEHLALFDQITGTYTFRYLARRLEYELLRSSLAQRPLAVLVVSIDKLPMIALDYGAAGLDEAVVEVATALMNNCRPIDMVGTYMEGRFVIVCPEINAADSGELANYMKDVCKDTVIRHHEDSLNVTVSIGIAVFTPDFADCETIIAIADMAADMVNDKGGDGYCFGTTGSETPPEDV